MPFAIEQSAAQRADRWLPLRTSQTRVKPAIDPDKKAFGPHQDHAQLAKVFSASREDQVRYSPPQIGSADTIVAGANLDLDRLCPSHVERSNLTIRLMLRWFPSGPPSSPRTPRIS
jgi:hypothetical protein